MSTHRKKSKNEQIPKPINIKKEKTEEDRTLHPISHYIDDRLELVKQIFGTLKPKTIMNLAPEFLKQTNLDEIEEMCLNELLCISTKRLKSIIAGTRCPTDTESSEDSDVQHEKEHVSLEEISSDSDIGDSSKHRVRKKKKIAGKTTKSDEKPTGQISVLELLELQARARAIRSQLAMEPVTKIEVDSDDEKESKKEKVNQKRKSSDQSNVESSIQKNANSNGKPPSQVEDKNTTKPATKKIKIKRNYRNATKSPEKIIEQPKSFVDAKQSKEKEKEKQKSKSRSASPDVIPIQMEPETLLISDSSEDEGNKRSVNTNLTAPEVAPAAAAPPPPPKEPSEPEEGEVTDESESADVQPTPTPTKKTDNADNAGKAIEEGKETANAKLETTDVIAANVVDEKTTDQQSVDKKIEEPPTESAGSTIIDDEAENDDVISIGADLEKEMIEELAKDESIEAKTTTTGNNNDEEQRKPEEDDNDVISLDTSEDECDKMQEISSESWRTRYLKSSKVSQVLAASRLGKRVRDKIKNTNRNQKQRSGGKSEDSSEVAQQQQQFTSQHEDGSVEQYQELLQHRQRKSSNNSNNNSGNKGD